MDADPQSEYEALVAEVNEHRRRYYLLDAPTISDDEYDKLERRLREFEEKHPELASPSSPTATVGGALSEMFEPVEHLEQHDTSRRGRRLLRRAARGVPRSGRHQQAPPEHRDRRGEHGSALPPRRRGRSLGPCSSDGCLDQIEAVRLSSWNRHRHGRADRCDHDPRIQPLTRDLDVHRDLPRRAAALV